MATPEQTKFKAGGGDLTCRFPQILSLSSPGPGGASMVLMQVFSYNDSVKSGVLRTYLNSDYSFSESSDKEFYHTDRSSDFKSVHYASQNEVYTVIVDTNSKKDYIVKFDISGANKYTTWFLETLDTNHGAGNKIGHLDSLITGLASDSRNLPIKGFLALSSRIFWTYNPYCDAGSLFEPNSFYWAFSTSDQSAMLGMYDRIEIDPRSCRREKTSSSSEGNLIEGAGRDTGDEKALTAWACSNKGSDTIKYGNLDAIDESVKDYKAAGTDTSLVLGDWEQTFNIKDRYWLCKSLSG